MAKNPAAVSLGRAGGKARAGKLTPAERSASAQKAAAQRWANHQTKRRRAVKDGAR